MVEGAEKVSRALNWDAGECRWECGGQVHTLAMSVECFIGDL